MTWEYGKHNAYQNLLLKVRDINPGLVPKRKNSQKAVIQIEIIYLIIVTARHPNSLQVSDNQGIPSHVNRERKDSWPRLTHPKIFQTAKVKISWNKQRRFGILNKDAIVI